MNPSLRHRSIGWSNTSGLFGFVRSVTQIGRPSPTRRGPNAESIVPYGPSPSWSSRRAGPPVQMNRHFWMQVEVLPDGSSTKSPTCLRLAGSAYEMT